MTNTIYIHQLEKVFSFTRLPNFLFEAPTFQSLSNEAKVLYAFILRRTELSLSLIHIFLYEIFFQRWVWSYQGRFLSCQSHPGKEFFQLAKVPNNPVCSGLLQPLLFDGKNSPSVFLI